MGETTELPHALNDARARLTLCSWRSRLSAGVLHVTPIVWKKKKKKKKKKKGSRRGRREGIGRRRFPLPKPDAWFAWSLSFTPFSARGELRPGLPQHRNRLRRGRSCLQADERRRANNHALRDRECNHDDENQRDEDATHKSCKEKDEGPTIGRHAMAYGRRASEELANGVPRASRGR